MPFLSVPTLPFVTAEASLGLQYTLALFCNLLLSQCGTQDGEDCKKVGNTHFRHNRDYANMLTFLECMRNGRHESLF